MPLKIKRETGTTKLNPSVIFKPRVEKNQITYVRDDVLFPNRMYILKNKKFQRFSVSCPEKKKKSGTVDDLIIFVFHFDSRLFGLYTLSS